MYLFFPNSSRALFPLCLLSLPSFCLSFVLFCLQGGGMFHEHRHLPCLHCHPHTYIRMVQHLIERCLLLRMNRDDCIEALAEHASIQPLITLTVWKELLKENRNFFEGYFHAISPRPYNCRPVQRVSRVSRRKAWK